MPAFVVRNSELAQSSDINQPSENKIAEPMHQKYHKIFVWEAVNSARIRFDFIISINSSFIVIAVLTML